MENFQINRQNRKQYRRCSTSDWLAVNLLIMFTNIISYFFKIFLSLQKESGRHSYLVDGEILPEWRNVEVPELDQREASD